MYLKYSKIRDVKNPNRAHITDAGIDLYIPEFNEKYLNDLCELNQYQYSIDNGNGNIWLDSNYAINIPSGIILEVPYGYMALFLNKSGIASKKHIVLGSCVIDSGYSGEIVINLNNIGTDQQILKCGDKIVQCVLIPISTCQLIEVDQNDLYKNINNERKDNGFGSTDHK